MTGTSSVASSGVRTSFRSESQTCPMQGPPPCVKTQQQQQQYEWWGSTTKHAQDPTTNMDFKCNDQRQPPPLEEHPNYNRTTGCRVARAFTCDTPATRCQGIFGSSRLLRAARTATAVATTITPQPRGDIISAAVIRSRSRHV